MNISFNISFIKTYQFIFSSVFLFGFNFSLAQEVDVIDRKGTVKVVKNNQVFYLQNGVSLPTIPAPLESDELFYTNTGTSSGVISESYIYDGISWVLRPAHNAVPLWISNTNGGTYLLNDIINYNGALYKNITATNTNTTPDLNTTNWQSLQITSPIRAYGKVNSNGIAFRVFGATVTRTSTGRYTVTLNTARPTQHYIISLTVVENINTRDDINIHVVTQTTNTFTVAIHEGDNGNTANTLRNRDWYFSVMDF